MEIANQILEGFLRAVFPEACPVCGVGCARHGPCANHRLVFPPKGPRCGRCAARLPRGLPDRHRCAACARRSPGIRTLVALGDYSARGPLRDWILALKHGGRAGLARPLGIELAHAWRARMELDAGPILVPVPLHPLRRLERGYDQARLLAEAVAEELAGHLTPALRRQRWTAPQGSVVASREANVAGAFGIRSRMGSRMKGRDVWLVDDVYTSGATLRACAKALRRGGARHVSAMVLGRAVRGEDSLDRIGG